MGGLAVTMDSSLVNTSVRLQVLPPAEAAVDTRVEMVSGGRLLVTCAHPLEVGAAIRLVTADRMLLAEVLASERRDGEVRALVDVQHSLLLSDIREIRSNWEAP